MPRTLSPRSALRHAVEDDIASMRHRADVERLLTNPHLRRDIGLGQHAAPLPSHRRWPWILGL